MNLFRLSLAYLRSRPLGTALNLLLLAGGVATITLLLLATTQLEERMGRDARGIDMVAGAKGSPMQLVLSAIYHLDAPTGNIPLADALALARHPAVRSAARVVDLARRAVAVLGSSRMDDGGLLEESDRLQGEQARGVRTVARNWIKESVSERVAEALARRSED